MPVLLAALFVKKSYGIIRIPRAHLCENQGRKATGLPRNRCATVAGLQTPRDGRTPIPHRMVANSCKGCLAR